MCNVVVGIISNTVRALICEKYLYRNGSRVVCDRLRLITDAVLMDEQGGFRVRRGCVDQIFAVRQVTEKVIEKDDVVYAAFVDLEKAFEMVHMLILGLIDRHGKTNSYWKLQPLEFKRYVCIRRY